MKNNSTNRDLEDQTFDDREELKIHFANVEERLRRDLIGLYNTPCIGKKEHLDKAFEYFSIGFLLLQSSLEYPQLIKLPEDES